MLNVCVGALAALAPNALSAPAPYHLLNVRVGALAALAPNALSAPAPYHLLNVRVGALAALAPNALSAPAPYQSHNNIRQGEGLGISGTYEEAVHLRASLPGPVCGVILLASRTSPSLSALLIS